MELMKLKDYLLKGHKDLVILINEKDYKLNDLSDLALDIRSSRRSWSYYYPKSPERIVDNTRRDEDIPEYIDDILYDLALVEEPGFECTPEEIEQLIEQLKIYIDQL